ncbi:hypothetical protein HYW94_04195 [Candidatus Uhrbacteria bacterium]|nr:hypothetical protein [Candidatus Uhrbacteria bacterium]
MEELFSRNTYMLRKKFFKFFGESFHIFDEQGKVVLFASMKAFKLREDIRLYTGEDKKQEVLSIQARQILDVSATYDVFVSGTQQKIGALRRKGVKSYFLKDEWVIMDAFDKDIGFIKEDSMLFALIRRFLTNLIPQTYYVDIGGTRVCMFKQRFNPFVPKMDIDFSLDTGHLLDHRLGIAAAVLLGAIEGRQ